MKTTLHRLLIATLAIGLLASCNRKPSFETIDTDREVSLPNCTYTVECQFTYLKSYRNPHTVRLIQRAMIEAVFGLEDFDGSPEEACKAYMAQLEADYGDSDTTYRWDGFFNTATSAELLNGRLLVYTVSNQSYTGGAHGIYGTTSYCFDLATGTPLALADILPEDNYEAFAALLRDSIIAKYERRDASELTQDGFFEPETIEPNENFALTGSSVIFRYNPYEIACYATGMVEVEIPYDQAAGLLDLTVAGIH